MPEFQISSHGEAGRANHGYIGGASRFLPFVDRIVLSTLDELMRLS
jgi:hypothetical protein